MENQMENELGMDDTGICGSGARDADTKHDCYA